MRRAKLILSLNIVMAVWCAPTYGQTNDPDQAPSIEQTVREFDRMMADSGRFRQSTRTSRTQTDIAPVLAAIPRFRTATADLREAVSAQTSMRVPLQNLEKLIKPFAGYFKDLKLKPPEPDVEELKSYSQKDLRWETLTTAERIDNNLQMARRLLIDSSRTGAVSIKTLQFYAEIDFDLKRLKWLADKAPDQR